MVSVTDHYETLGVSHTAPDEVIRAAYKVRIRQAHPDAGGDAVDAQRVNDAFSVLSDPLSRANYDREQANSEPVKRAEPPLPSQSAPAAGSTSSTFATSVVKRWWKRRATLVAGAVFLMAITSSTVLAMLNGVDRPQLMLFLALSVSAIVWATAARWMKPLAFLLVATAALGFASPSLAPLTAGWLALALTTGLIIRRSITNELTDLSLAAADHFWAALDAQGVDAWFVEDIVAEGSQTRTLLQHLDSDSRVTRVLWGQIEQGSYLILGDADEPLMSVPYDLMERAAKASDRRTRKRDAPRI
ncbi:J domain-containing protein [Microbacterium gorillae]|uniref:J domain-containing protein n=1 Tax=Microbacterium gorillae TaxID=1231063 RepID=UPI003D967CC3